MIPLSAAAERHLNELTRYYAALERDEAIDNLVDSVEQASARFLNDLGLVYPAPRPYPHLIRTGWRWTKQGRYWIAFSQSSDGPVIEAIFFDAADMPGRL